MFINRFHSAGPFLYRLKTSGNPKEYRNRLVASNLLRIRGIAEASLRRRSYKKVF